MKGLFFAGLAVGTMVGALIVEMQPEIAKESKNLLKKIKSKTK